MMIFRVTAVATLMLAIPACGGAPPEPATPVAPLSSAAPSPGVTPGAPPPSPTAAEPAAPGIPPHDVWREGMSENQEIAFMKRNVVPEMAPVFKSYDAERYSSFGCKTCHGPKFREPEDYLPVLTFKDGKLTAFTDHPQIAKFMAEQVVPHMATAMGLPPYDVKTNTGFGCHGCHQVQMK